MQNNSSLIYQQLERHFEKKQAIDAIQSQILFLQGHYKTYLSKNHKTFRDFGDLNEAGLNQNIFLCGRLMCTTEGNINPKSTMLEVVCENGEAQRILLEINDKELVTQEFLLFAGQIVAIEGAVQNSPRRFTVSGIFTETVISLLQEQDIIDEVKKAKSIIQRNDPNTSIIIVSGPYTTQTSLSFSPFGNISLFPQCDNYKEKFLNFVEDTPPDVLILTGPFLDEDHEIIKTGRYNIGGQNYTLKALYEQLWKLVLQKLPKSRIIVVPSLKDANSISPLPQQNWTKMFPQFRRIVFLSNPTSFKIDGDSIFHCVSQDVLLAILKKSFFSASQSKDRISNALRQVLHQRNVIPFRPTELSFDPLSISELNLKSIPDFIISPSLLQTHIKLIDGTIFINPGQLYKGKLGGSFCKMTIFEEESVMIQFRTKCEIISF